MLIRNFDNNDKQQRAISAMAISEGIDTISLQVNEQYINKDQWYETHALLPYVTLKTCCARMKLYFKVHIQFEALDMNNNVFLQIVGILTKMVFCNIIIIPNEKPYEPINVYKYISAYLPYIAKLSACDFFFDFKEKDIKRYITYPPQFETTTYSPDHRYSKSLWIVYDRRERLKQVNQLRWDIIDAMPYPMRLEIRLNRRNCKYLNLNNLNGTYYQIVLNNFHNYIAKSLRKYANLVGTFRATDYHRVFNSIFWMSMQDKIPRFDLYENDTSFI